MVNLKNKVSIITGAASGIGQATAVHFASLGSYLSLSDLNQSALDATVALCLKEGLSPENITTYAGDISLSDVQEGLVKKTIDHFGRLDVLVNNAGMARLNQTLESTTMAQLERIMDVNLKAMIRLIQLSTPYLKMTKGSVVNVSSRTSMAPEPFSLPYCLSKAGVDQLTRFAAIELAPFEVRVNSINPGSVRTNIVNNIPGTSAEAMKDLEEKSIKLGLFKRMAHPLEIAKPIAFLASDDASFITGIHMLVDGGRAPAS